MKIVNKENDQEVVYVQNNDMMYVIHNCESIPAALIDSFFSDIVIICEENRNEFVRFTDPNEVNFFKEQDWIVDYRALKNLSEAEIMEMGKKVLVELKEVEEKFNSSTNEEEKDALVRRHQLLEHKFDSIRDFLWCKQGHIKLSLPVVPDSEGFKFTGDVPYRMAGSLEPNKILLYREDGAKLSETEQIPVGFVQMGMSIAIMDKNNCPAVMGDYSVKKYLSDDGKYLIIEYVFQDYKKVSEQTPEESVQETGIRRLIKRIFKKN